MRKTILLIMTSLMSLSTFAQWTTDGNSVITDKNVSIPFYTNLGAGLDDVFKHNNNTMGHYALGWMDDPWPSSGPTLWQSGFGGIKFFTGGNYRIGITGNGNVGIGTENPEFKLDVNGDIRSQGLRLEPKSMDDPWRLTNFYYSGHSLRIGPPKGGWATTSIEIVPGSSTREDCFSFLKLYSTNMNEEYLEKIVFSTYGNSFLNGPGYVGIGTDQPKSKLDVKGDIRATEIKIEDISNWSDFVFDKDYKLPSLSEVEDHINTFKHLPEIPSEAQVKEEGINIVEMQAKLLQKIEELTLYIIKQDKEIKELREAIGNN